MLMYTEKLLDHFRNPRNMGRLEDADGVGTVGNPVCLMSGTNVYCNPEVKAIENVLIGDKVINSKGSYSDVTKTSGRKYNGSLFGIRNFMGKTYVTDDHLIRAISMHKVGRDKSKKYKKLAVEWIHAKNLRKGDVVIFPLIEDTVNKNYLKLDIDLKKWDFRSKKLPKKVKINKHLMRVIGYYLSEGSVGTKKCRGFVCFTFSIKEENTLLKETIISMKNSFGLEPSKIYRRETANSIHLFYYSAPLARFFEKEFGKGAKNKKIPTWMLYLRKPLQKEFIRAIWNGDGYVAGKSAKYISISEQLVMFLQLILLRHEIVGSLNISEAYGIHKRAFSLHIKNINGLEKICRILNIKKKLYQPKKRQNNYWFDKNYCYMIVSDIDKKHYRGLVHDLTVKENHSYCTSSLLVHNCGDVMKLYIKVKDNRIEDIKFETFGCAAAIGTSSMITELAKGKTLDEALKIENAEVAESLDGLPPVKMHCSVLAADALKAAIEDYKKKN